MKFRSVSLIVALVVLGAILFVAGSHSQAAPHPQATESAEIPPDAKMLQFDQPVTETITPEISGLFYKFSGKVDQLVRLSLEPKTGNYNSTATILDSANLDTIIGGTQGENIIGGSLIVRLPADGTYAVIIDFGPATKGTPAPGSYVITLSPVQAQ